MLFWITQLLPYFVFAIYQFSSKSPGPPAPLPAVFCPPGVPFRPVHFTEYPLKYEYKDYTPEKILELNPLARIQSAVRYNQQGPWIFSTHKLFIGKFNYPPCRVPVHQSPSVSWIVARNRLEGGLKWTFIHSQKEDSLRNLLVYGPGVKETIWICQYLESSNNILDSLYLVFDFCISVLDVCSLDLDSCSLNLDSSTLHLDSGAALRIQLPILGLLLRYLGLYQSNQAPAGDQKAFKTSWQKLRRPGKDLQKPSKRP
ncbi:hypothetical protein DSO57_1026399 [Entomophthora muscae]|uniref:Uncharacterized protein n=1 Tax=Entomophthora muscae TaxID=34485 RepID=A0ACC2TD79_9FUNG|nr:hypothetical protein DSO57_1026399 [Entomophthora muscae]